MIFLYNPIKSSFAKTHILWDSLKISYKWHKGQGWTIIIPWLYFTNWCPSHAILNSYSVVDNSQYLHRTLKTPEEQQKAQFREISSEKNRESNSQSNILYIC